MCMGMDLHEREALEESLRQYEQQLQAVDLALQSSDASQAADLAELKRNLEEVISLTKSKLQHHRPYPSLQMSTKSLCLSSDRILSQPSDDKERKLRDSFGTVT